MNTQTLTIDITQQINQPFYLKIAQYLWGTKARVYYLLIAAAVMLCAFLGGRELWTQEWRWANISWYMMYSKDYLHPYLAGSAYYDKPLLSYWLMILFSHVLGGLNEWALRLPPALAGILTVYCTYRLGARLVNQRMGFIAGWMLLSTYFFIFWARTANADMLNLAGTMLAVLWYFEHKDNPRFFSLTIFFVILSVTSLFKGLIGIIIPLIAIAPDVLKDRTWKKYLHPRMLFACVPAALIYALPFWASQHFGNQHYAESGLYEVYRENVLRYFKPFDHEGPIYTYFIFLPVYTLPWALFLLPAMLGLKKHWSQMSANARWCAWSTLLIFLFFTLSGSRRNYYILPLVPFAILLIANWLAEKSDESKRIKYAAYVFILGYFAAFMSFAVIQPLYYSNGGLRPFAKELQKTANAVQPWPTWNIIFLDARSKLTMYLDPAKPIQLLDAPNSAGKGKHIIYTQAQLTQAWPLLLQPQKNTIYVSRELYLPLLQPYFVHYRLVHAKPSLGERLLHQKNPDRPIAFIPQEK